MENKGVVFFDVDGTLIDWTKKIYAPTKATKAAIEKLRDNGYLTILATGRPMNIIFRTKWIYSFEWSLCRNR